jgi:pimeloyl-ACP methyl ester carboxylesterase
MATEVILPRVDMDMTSGKFGQWFFQEGAAVEKGQPLFEIETDKAAMEVEAPASGVLRGVSAKSGDELPVGSVIAWICGPDEAYKAPPIAASAVAEPRAVAPAREASPHHGQTSGEVLVGLRATPTARRLARERGVDLARLGGSGPKGRIQAKDVAAPKGGRAAAGRAALRRVWFEQGEAAPLVFLHGFGADLNAWRPLIRVLKSARPILALDLPGHGKSALAGAINFEAIIGTIEATLVEEAISAFHLVGHSLGGAVAGAIAARDSRRVRSLTLISPAGLGPEINDAFRAGFLGAQSEETLAPWVRLLTSRESIYQSALVKTALRQRADPALVIGQEKIASSLFAGGAQAFSIRESLARLAIPAKVIFGLDDQIIPARHASGLSGAIALHLFAHVGHMPHLEAQAAVARLIEEAAAAGDATLPSS